VLPISLPVGRDGRLKLLILGAHADDIEIGCAGTIIRLLEEGRELEIRWVVFGADESRRAEAEASATELLQGVSRRRIDVLRFRNGYFASELAAIKDQFEALKSEFEPSLILTHWTGDAHQDHRAVAELSHQTFRNHVLLEYEIPKYDGDLGNPNFFVGLSASQLQRKLEILRRHFPSQQGRHWFTDDTFRAMARLRGIGCRSESGLAEAFHARKLFF